MNDQTLISKLINTPVLSWAKRPDGSLVVITAEGKKLVFSADRLQAARRRRKTAPPPGHPTLPIDSGEPDDCHA